MSCFNCGTVGHIARNCTYVQSPFSETVNGNYVTGRVFVRNKKSFPFPNQTLLCYKCNKAGHFARNCESEKAVCYGCGNQDHLFKQCSVSVKKVCYKCSSPDHLMKDCTQQNHLPTDDQTVITRTTSALVRNDQCYSCKGRGHIARNCPSKSAIESVCYRCNRPGHIARNCNFY